MDEQLNSDIYNEHDDWTVVFTMNVKKMNNDIYKMQILKLPCPTLV